MAFRTTSSLCSRTLLICLAHGAICRIVLTADHILHLVTHDHRTLAYVCSGCATGSSWGNAVHFNAWTGFLELRAIGSSRAPSSLSLVGDSRKETKDDLTYWRGVIPRQALALSCRCLPVCASEPDASLEPPLEKRRLRATGGPGCGPRAGRMFWVPITLPVAKTGRIQSRRDLCGKESTQNGKLYC